MTTLVQVVVRVSSEGAPQHQHSHLAPHLASPLVSPSLSTAPLLDLQPAPSSLEIVTAVTFSVGLIQALIGLLRVGSLTLVINDVIISSFTTGASLHVATSQVRHVLGLGKLSGVSGPGRLVQTYLTLGNHFSHLSTS